MRDLWARKEAFVRYENSQIIVTAPFDGDYVKELKSGTYSRRWNPDKYIWTVAISERDRVLEITRQYYDVIEENQPSESVQAEESQPAPIYSLPPASPFEVDYGDSVEVWTDGACLNNPGPGGYAVVMKYNGQKRELVGGYRLTTNNRMELLAAIVGLESLKLECKVTIYSDSKLLVEAMTGGWAKRWQSNGWRKNPKEKAINPDLWQRLLELCTKHDVQFIWVKGHASSPENERCDKLAEAISRMQGLIDDEGYLNEANTRRKKTLENKPQERTPGGPVCPICGGTGYRLTAVGQRNLMPQLGILCSQCLGRGTI